MAREVALSVRVEPELKAAVTRAAAADGRTVSSWVARLIQAHLKEAEQASGGPKGQGNPAQA